MLLISFGTLFEYFKIKPLIKELKEENIPYRVLHIREQDNFSIDIPHEFMDIYDISSDRLNNIHLNVLDQAENWFKETKAVLVVGSSQSAFSLVYAAFLRRLKIIHLEAGLRTFNKEDNEEFNRRSISLMTDIHLCSTIQSAKNLSLEGIRTPRHIIGSTLLDNIDSTPIEEESTILVEFNNGPRKLEWLKEISILSKDTPTLNYVSLYTDKKEDIINQIKLSKIIISDNGDIQELACYLHKKIIICKKVTERPEGIWLNGTMCKNPDYLRSAFWKILPKQLTNYSCPYGDGKTTEKIIPIIKEVL